MGMTSTSLPRADTVLAVCAHPDDESFGLGAVASAFVEQGTDVGVLSFTHGEASTLGMTLGELRRVRAEEFEQAAGALGICARELLDYPDGGLASVSLDELAAHVRRVAEALGADLLLVFDEGGITGHPDHQAATAAALSAVASVGVPVLAWAVLDAVAHRLNIEFDSSFIGRRDREIDIYLRVNRLRQREAITRHRSQSMSNPVLARRIELQGDVEWLLWLKRPARVESSDENGSEAATDASRRRVGTVELVERATERSAP